MKTPLTIPGGSARIVQWKDKKSGKLVASSRTAIAPRKPAEPSATHLRLVVDALLGEAAAASDPALRSRLYAAAAGADAKARTAEARERPDPKPLDPAQIDRMVAEATERFSAV